MKLWPPPRLAEVRDLGLLVVGAAHPVADQGADDGEAGAFNDLLNGIGDVADAAARAADMNSRGLLPAVSTILMPLSMMA